MRAFGAQNTDNGCLEVPFFAGWQFGQLGDMAVCAVTGDNKTRREPVWIAITAIDFQLHVGTIARHAGKRGTAHDLQIAMSVCFAFWCG